jgi:hypothetical protein
MKANDENRIKLSNICLERQKELKNRSFKNANDIITGQDE